MGAEKKASELHQNKESLEEKIKPHDLLFSIPEMCLPYSVAQNENGTVNYLNQDLAREMGILKDQSISEFKKDILNCFNLQIINEHDRLFHKTYKAKNVKPFFCFATRYLQLQHQNKQGRTSGDGRAIWNGVIKNKSKVWDISSRGTGVTSLAPGAVEAKTALPTGCTDYGYACGLSELKEIYASIIMSERLYKLGFSTERILACIDIGNGLGICVRAGENLIRPAHLFRYLKLNDHFGAQKLLDHVIKRDYKNKRISFSTDDKNCYDLYLKHFCKNFEDLCAKSNFFEVFVWLDWDGDNILIDGGIIDYGSVRHFGSHHDQYKYEDVDRFSTNLNEQVHKAKVTLQSFIQLVDFVKTKKKKPLSHFKKSKLISDFKKNVELKELKLFLSSLGASKPSIEKAISWNFKKVQNTYNEYLKLKKIKASKVLETGDGKNSWPAYNVNALLSDLKSLSEKSDLKKYQTEFTTFNHSKELKMDEVLAFKKMILDLCTESGFKFSYSGDFEHRLTTSAVLHLTDLVDLEQTKSKKQKFLNSCINFGYLKSDSWVEEVKDLYRDEL